MEYVGNMSDKQLRWDQFDDQLSALLHSADELTSYASYPNSRHTFRSLFLSVIALIHDVLRPGMHPPDKLMQKLNDTVMNTASRDRYIFCRMVMELLELNEQRQRADDNGVRSMINAINLEWRSLHPD